MMFGISCSVRVKNKKKIRGRRGEKKIEMKLNGIRRNDGKNKTFGNRMQLSNFYQQKNISAGFLVYFGEVEFSLGGNIGLLLGREGSHTFLHEDLMDFLMFAAFVIIKMIPP